MAAPHPSRRVTVTLGTVWRFQLQPPPPRPPRVPVNVAIFVIIIAVARVIFGVVYFTDCPQQPPIPIYLIGLVFVPVLLVSLEALPCEEDPHQLQERLICFRGCIKCFLRLFVFTWILLGDVWVFFVYQPNYDPSAADGLYCNKTLYTFAFWNAVLETFGMVIHLATFCRGLMFFVSMSPVPGDMV